MSMNWVHMHFWDHVDSEFMLYVGVECKGAEFISNKFTHSHTEIRVLIQIVNTYLYNVPAVF